LSKLTYFSCGLFSKAFLDILIALIGVCFGGKGTFILSLGSAKSSLTLIRVSLALFDFYDFAASIRSLAFEIFYYIS